MPAISTNEDVRSRLAQRAKTISQRFLERPMPPVGRLARPEAPPGAPIGRSGDGLAPPPRARVFPGPAGTKEQRIRGQTGEFPNSWVAELGNSPVWPRIRLL